MSGVERDPAEPQKARRDPLMAQYADLVAGAEAELKAAGLRGSAVLTHQGMSHVAVHVTGVKPGGRAVPRNTSVEMDALAIEVALKRLVRDIISVTGG